MTRTIITGLCLALLLAAPARALEAGEPGHARVAPGPGAVFPIVGEAGFGTFENRFGGGRNHQGQDVLAGCGTPILAAAPGEVVEADFHGSAGHYVVLRVAGGRSHVYAHLLVPARVRVGYGVRVGDRIGSVGQTGRASTCHLHFEIWTAPGWYRGGHPVDPKPFLSGLPRR